MGQTQHKYAAVHLYSDGIESCQDMAPSVAYLLPGQYCDNADEFGRDKTKLLGGLFYQSKSEWWNGGQSDFGLGKLPYQGSALENSAESDICGGFAFDCPEIALYSNQTICDYESMCAAPTGSDCAGRTLGHENNTGARPSSMLTSAVYYLSLIHI